MLRVKSALLGLVVCFPGGPFTSDSGYCRADEEILPNVELNFDRPSTGHEKACKDELADHGVCFPTQLYTNHLSAYRPKMVQVQMVDAGRLGQSRTAGQIKSTAASDQSAMDLRLLAQVFEADQMPATGESSSVELLFQRDNHPSPVVTAADSHPFAETNAYSSSDYGDHAYGNQSVDSSGVDVQTVAYQNPAPMVEDAPAATEVAQENDNKARLFGNLAAIELKKSIRTEADLPEQGNPGRDHFSIKPPQHHWKSGEWSGIRPPRNTFPFYHNPLYFEDPNLERCGRSAGYLTELRSIAFFAGRMPVLPYMMTVEPPCTLVKAKPDCPTCQKFGPDAYFPHPDEISLGGTAVQAAAIVGLVFLIP